MLAGSLQASVSRLLLESNRDAIENCDSYKMRILGQLIKAYSGVHGYGVLKNFGLPLTATTHGHKLVKQR
jgi:hypothetical protein